MKTENFDDAIRRKIESIAHSFEEKEIEGITKYVNANNKSISFWKPNSTTIMVSFFGVVISALLYLNYKQMNTQNQLLNKIESLQTDLMKQSSAVKTDTIFIANYGDESNTNTTISNKYSSIEKRITTKRKSNVPLGNSKNATQYESATASLNPYDNQTEASYDDNLTNQKYSQTKEGYGNSDRLINTKPDNSNKRKGSKGIEINGKRNLITENVNNEDMKNISSRANKDSTNVLSVQNRSQADDDSDSVLKDDNQETAIAKLDVAKGKPVEYKGLSANEAKDVSNSKAVLNYNLAQKSNSNRIKKAKVKRQNKIGEQTTEDSNDKTDELKTMALADKSELDGIGKNNKQRLDSLENQEENLNKNRIADTLLPAKMKVKKPFLAFKNIQYQVGISPEMANSQFGIGIIGEVFLNKRFSLNAGVKYLTINNEAYDNDEDFDRNHRNFRSSYTPYMQDTCSISNIDIKAEIVQLPLAINYYQPLKRNFSLVFSAGTDLDLYVKQRLHYDFSYYDNAYPQPNYQINNPYYQPKNHKAAEVNHPSMVLNNLMFSAGVQKQWNHFVVQASPFISPQIKDVEYKKNNLYAGLRVRLFYRF